MARTAKTIAYFQTSDDIDSTGDAIDALVGSNTGITYANFFNARDNYGILVVNNTTVSAKDITLISGGVYPPSSQGDKVIEIPASTVAVVRVDEPARFSTSAGTLNVDFETGMTGFCKAIVSKTSLGL